MHYTKDDRNLLKCAECGKYRTESLEDFKVVYKENGQKVWLCDKCARYLNIFKGIAHGTTLVAIIAPGETDLDTCKVYTKDMYN